MKNTRLEPPKLAKMLLNIILPKHVKDDICGDLDEEFHQYIKVEKGNTMASRWFWGQTLSTCTKYLLTREKLLSTLIVLITIGTLATLYIAITLLSHATDATFYYSDDFWYNGNIHLLFFEAKFWDYTSDKVFQSLPITHLTDLNSGLWSGLALFTIFKLDKKFQFSTPFFSTLSFLLMLCPYIYGVIIFQVSILDNKEVGPLIALMWLPIMYMIIPIAYLILTKLNTSLKPT